MRAAVFVLGAAMAFPAFAQSTIPTDAEILSILENRVDEEQQSIGIAVGIVEADGARVITYGTLSKDDQTPVDGDTLFEIGSVTKIFTTLLLADAVERGEVQLDQPVADFLPDGVTMPEHDGRQITLLDLATQRSGLPRLPDNMDPADPTDPYADYTTEELYAFLSGYELPRGVDEEYEYSNLGMGLLGHVLALNAGTDYATLLDERILTPLGMDDTFLVVPAELEARFAVGHDENVEPVESWTWDVLEGAGVLRSSVNDLNILLSALLGYTETDLSPAIALATEPHVGVGDGVTQMGLGFHISPLGEDEMVWHNGGTFGARSFFGLVREAGVGVVALSNVATPHGTDDLAAHLLDPTVPLVVPLQAVEVDPAVFDGLVGEYELAPEVMIEVFTEDDKLMAVLTGQEPAQIFPLSETEYFYRIVDAQVVFDVDEDGSASGLTLHQFGMEMPAPRVE